MPVKNEENVSAGSPVSMNKTKKTRYSLKKLLDRSRFSPRLLRIPRLNKSTDGDQEGDGELKATCFNVEGDLVRESDVRYNLSDRAIPSNRQYAASVPLDPVQHSHSDSGTQTPTGMSEPSDQTPENFVEEEYEESLTQFADLIIEGLKNSPSLRSNQPREVHTQSSSSSLRVRNEPPTSNNAPSLSLHAARFCPPVVNGKLTPPLKFDTVHPLTSIPLQVPALDECAIYNEPCDAKPSPGNNPEDSVTIYTVNLFTPDATEVGCTRGSSKGGSPNSSQSSITDTETCALRVVNKTTTLSSGTTGYDRHETNGNIATRDDANNGELKDCLLSSTAVTDVPRSTTSGQVPRSASPTASLTPTQGQLGFVDTPRGNSVIVHHPTSPFARVPRGTILPQVTPCSAAAATPVPTSTGPNQSTESRPNINLTSLVRLSPGQASCADVGNSRAPINTTPSVPISGTSGSTIWKKSAPSGGPTVDGNSTGPRVRANNADTQPTYEEAWDLKMARQLGFGISRLTPVHVPVTIPGVLSSNLGPESRLAPVASTKVVTTGPTVSGSSSSSSSSSVRAHGERHQRSGLKFHENRLFDQHPTKSKNDASCAQTGTAATEYDYAYNGSWSMGVKLNLCLAMNGASETGDGSTGPTVSSNPTVLPYRPAVPVGNTNKTDSVHVCGPPPQVPAHQTQSSHMNGFAVGSASHGAEIVSTGSRSKRGDPSALNIMTGSVLPSAEVDSTSTDSYDDSWEARHGRVVSELTSARFVDPSSLLLNESTSACPVLSTGQPLSVHVGADALSHVVHHTEPSNRTSSSPSASVSHSQITPTGTGGVSPSVNSTLELLPLEEQPWFHQSLKRLEAEELLRNQPEGSFLVRKSETCPNDYSLTIKHKTFLHMKISRNAAGQYILGEYSQPYAAVPQMIYHYARTLVPVRGAESVTLTHPVCSRLP